MYANGTQKVVEHRAGSQLHFTIKTKHERVIYDQLNGEIRKRCRNETPYNCVCDNARRRYQLVLFQLNNTTKGRALQRRNQRWKFLIQLTSARKGGTESSRA